MMINRRDTPAPSMQQHAPPSLRSANPKENVYGSTPQTPRNKTRTKRASKVQRKTPHEAYVDGNARSAADQNVPDERISHDLSLTDNGRHSVVDNMLMSLNPDQSPLFSSPEDRPTQSADSNLASPPRTANRHLHSSSLNSEFSFPSDDSPNRRGRRSNSSTNFQSALSRINSVHVDGEVADATGARLYPAQRAGVRGVEIPPWGGRKNSKGSGASSVDFGQIGGQTRFPHAFGRRSASFDMGDRNRVLLHSASSGSTQPQNPGSMSEPALYDDLEAAPTPTVPGGPRKDRTAVFSSRPTHTAPAAPMLQRRTSNKSSKSHAAKPKLWATVGWDAPTPGTANTWSGRPGSKQVQSMPTHLRSRNVSPTRQYSDPSISQRMDTHPAKDPARDRPGFFRRVFGSSRVQSTAHSDLQAPRSPQMPIPSSKGGTRVSSREGYSAPHKLSKAHPDEIYHSSPGSEPVPPSLVKKPSSFFRRRKKSTAEPMPVPVLPHHFQPNAQSHTEPTQHSPVSSLRQVMNPYLDNPVQSDATQFAGTAEYTKNPLQTYTLKAKGSADPTHQDHDARQDAGFNNPLRQAARDLPSANRESTSERLHLRPLERSSSKPYDNSFFHDDSSNETRLPGVADDYDVLRHPLPKEMRPRKEKDKLPEHAVYHRPHRRSLDTPRDRTLQTLNGNLPPSPLTSNPTPGKSKNREWLTSAQVTPTKKLTPTKKQPAKPGSAKDADRIWLQSANSKEGIRGSEMTLPIERAEVSPISDYQSASSTLPARKPNGDIPYPKPTAGDLAQAFSIEHNELMRPNELDIGLARQLYDGDETLVEKSMAAAYLGEPGTERTRLRQAYMELFDWQGLNILTSLRRLCERLYLKGEAQQVDRVLDAFSTRWCACNPNHAFKATDVVHTICYSILLLNTDLHQAEIETKMTRQQFLKNVLPTVRRVVTEAAPDAFTNARASTLPPARALADSSQADTKSPTVPETSEGRRSFEGQRPAYRLSQRPSDHTAYTSTPPQSPLELTGSMVSAPFHGKLSTWENKVEVVLKDIYNSIRLKELPLHGNGAKEPATETQQSSHGLSAMTSSMLRRTPSVLSKAGSENVSYSRGGQSENRLGTGRWQSKNRSRPRLYPASTVASSRRSSIDEQSSVTSPSITSAWSRFSSFGKTQTSLSIDSFANNYPHGDYKQSIGFANALSQAIIREEGVTGEEEPLRAAPLLEDESLELAGAPWAKEGNLKHKYHLEAVEKKAKDRNWVDSFAVIEKGYLRLFSFNMNAKSLRQKAKNQKAPGGVVGGGNWMDSAETLGNFLLRHTLASALPPPGYSKTRPHVWALSLPTGAVHLFQVGTPEIVKEFVTTANYWSARLSKEPIVGGISNIEYGWSESVINISLLNAERNDLETVIVNGPGPRTRAPTLGAPLSGPNHSIHYQAPPHHATPHHSRPSLQSSIKSTRSSLDQGAYRARLPGDRVAITDWTPPQQSLTASVLMEVDQLKNLLTYVENITEELQKHNELRAPMLLAFSPRHPNATKAMSNWERKSSHLLREIVKFRTYIDCLKSAQTQKERIYAERETTSAGPAAGEEQEEGMKADGEERAVQA